MTVVCPRIVGTVTESAVALSTGQNGRMNERRVSESESGARGDGRRQEMIVRFFNGLCMAFADSVPGVSGSTVAFILGFYEEFIGSLHGLMSRDSQARKRGALFLAKLGVGWLAGMALAVTALSQLFESNVYFMSSLFLGLTVCAIPFIAHEERASFERKVSDALFVLVGFAVVVFITMGRSAFSSMAGIDFTSLALPQYAFLIVAGAAAISAMLLPGVSGSTVLLILGVYVPTVEAAHALMGLDASVVPGLLALLAGVLLGMLLAVGAIRRALSEHRSKMMYLVMGLMAGSLVAIVMGPTTLSVPHAPLGLASFDPIGFFVGCALIAALEGAKRTFASRKVANEKA